MVLLRLVDFNLLIPTNGLYAELLVVVKSEAVTIEVRPLGDLAGPGWRGELHD